MLLNDDAGPADRAQEKSALRQVLPDCIPDEVRQFGARIRYC